MKPFIVQTDESKISSINRTIRMKPQTFEQLTLLSESTGVSFNKLVNQCIEYAFSQLETPSDDKNPG